VNIRRTLFGLSSALGLARRGFFIPYRGADRIAAPGSRPPYTALAALFGEYESAFEDHLGAIEEYATALESLGGEPPPAPRWTQDWFPRLDAAAAYAMVRRCRPQRVVEVGSGHSTRFLVRAAADAGLALAITAIDPSPRASLAGLNIEVMRVAVQDAGTAAFKELSAGDLLFVDSSHVLMPGTDVDYLVNRVLPDLPAGVHVHFHDIFLPNDYPPSWDWRGYNEQLAVAALVSTGKYVPEFSSAYVVAARPQWIAKGVISRLPIQAGAFESSLWLRKA